jgi:hypothetical protein
MTQVLTGNFVHLLLSLLCKTNQRSIPFGSPSVADSGASDTSSMFSGVTIAEEATVVGDNGSQIPQWSN